MKKAQKMMTWLEWNETRNEREADVREASKAEIEAAINSARRARKAYEEKEARKTKELGLVDPFELRLAEFNTKQSPT